MDVPAPSELRERLQKLDDVELDALAMDYFPTVYDKFGRGLRRDEKISLLVDHCRKSQNESRRLLGVLDKKNPSVPFASTSKTDGSVYNVNITGSTGVAVGNGASAVVNNIAQQSRPFDPRIEQDTQSDCILIVTVANIEAKTVLKVFSDAVGKPWSREQKRGQILYNLGTHGARKVYMVQSEMGIGTPGGAILTIMQAVESLKPEAVIMCGMAFGVKSGQKLGDILVSKQVTYYDPQKIGEKPGGIPRGDRVTASPRLLAQFRAGAMDWQGAEVYFGLILSGEKLVNNLSFRNKLLKQEPEAIGGEMEAAGLYAAASQLKTDWIMVKAICDWADGNKDDKAQLLAAKNAARFLLHVLTMKLD